MASSSGGNFFSLLDPDKEKSSPPIKRKKNNNNHINLNNQHDFPKISRNNFNKNNKQQCPKFVVLKSKIAEKASIYFLSPKPLRAYQVNQLKKLLLLETEIC